MGVLIRAGALLSATGLIILITPFDGIGFFLLFSGVIVACVSWGTSRSEARPANVATVGGLLVLLGLLWMGLYSSPWSCFGARTCYSWFDVIANPLFLLGTAVFCAGAFLVTLTVFRWIAALRTRAGGNRSATLSQ